jgi:methylenetetrahydrofolate dehydrogenase (NADP+)/methenyltetrahydrofolate cyclohydrolase
VERLSRKAGKRPGLVVIQVGDDPGSLLYVNNKKKACEEAGIRSYSHHLPASVSQLELLALIDQLNADTEVHGILCQLPLPDHIDEFTIICAIKPEKDVDGFHPVNVGLLSLGRDCLLPCTPAGIIAMLKANDLPIMGKRCVIVGRSNIVGKPVAQLMLREHATVTIAHSRTQDLPGVCREADILIVAIGRPQMINADYVKPGAVVIDVGINRNEQGKVVGDVDFASVAPIAGAITPVPGGVGLMTVAMLLKNTVDAFCRIEGLHL